jgi:hypothetical protein
MKTMNADSQELPVELYSIFNIIQRLDKICRSEDHEGTTECSSVVADEFQ